MKDEQFDQIRTILLYIAVMLLFILTAIVFGCAPAREVETTAIYQGGCVYTENDTIIDSVRYFIYSKSK